MENASFNKKENREKEKKENAVILHFLSVKKWSSAKKNMTRNAKDSEREILPGWVIPSHYRVSITPNVEGDFKFSGSVEIEYV
jgi:hypothetical protein